MDVLSYLLKSAGLLSLFFLGYEFLLKKETFFGANRFFLLSGVLFSAVLPMLVVEKVVWITQPAKNFNFSSPPLSKTTSAQDFWASFTLWDIFTFLALLGIFILAVQFLLQLISLGLLLRKTSIHHKENGIQYRYLQNDVSPFSFFKIVVVNPDFYTEKELSLILSHEQKHALEWHSVDLILAKLATVFLWFSPFSWLYLKRVRENLEFIADQKTTAKLTSLQTYQESLVKASLNNNISLPVTNFHHSFIKKRIVMLHKTQSNRNRFLKATIMLPLLAIFLWSFNVKTVEKKLPPEKINLNQLQQKIPLYYIDGKKATKKEADSLDPKSIKSIDVLKGKNAIQVYGKKAKDGVVLITTKNTSNKTAYQERAISTFSKEPLYILNGRPISKIEMLAIDTDSIASINVLKKGAKSAAIYGTRGANGVVIITTKTEKTAAENTLKKNSGEIKVKKLKSDQIDSKEKDSAFHKKPVYFMNGMAISQEKMKEIDPNTIESIHVLKGKTALKKYGEKAKNGAIEITLKKTPEKSEK